MPFHIFRRPVICISGSFAVQFGDHSWTGEYLRSEIIWYAVYSAVQYHIKHMKMSSVTHVGPTHLRAIMLFAEAITLHQENID